LSAYTASAFFSEEVHGQSGEKLLAAPHRGSFLAWFYFRPPYGFRGRRSFAVLKNGRDITLRPEHDPDHGWLPPFGPTISNTTITNITWLPQNVRALGLFFQTMHFFHFLDNQRPSVCRSSVEKTLF
jgi:hypothetical protein